MTEMTDRQFAQIVQILDAISDEYAQNNKIIFANESERARQHFGSVKRGLKNWGKSKQCMVPNCGAKSIVRSHAIPKGMSLTAIGESGHVLVPFFDQRNGRMRLEKTGLADATTFPGFCEKHESLFSAFENKKSIDTESDVALQIYRAACRELFRARFMVEQVDWTFGEYVRARDDGLVRLIRERANAYGLPNDLDFRSFSMKDDPLLADWEERIYPLREQAKYLAEHLVPKLEKAVFESDASGLNVVAMKVDLEFPVALVGAAPFYVNDGGQKMKVVLLVNVVPSVNSTLVLMASSAEAKAYVDIYVARWTRHILAIVSMIESWMINGTDQWCLRPSVWDAIDSARQSRILENILSDSNGIADECDVSIFDELRATLIEKSDVANAQNMTDAYQAYIASEQRKMRVQQKTKT